ncbi:hypothetical protein AAFF_G00056790 [Aldrovandia affinis]|uniref:Uncharacterized protein n=1 Tax=Aldrovandia affinis TaxID=143900 RepID=A0AAD7WF93_9TELE|nr:hypothetical protein AAFF_G00056790 [Aldrovandia affinis]
MSPERPPHWLSGSATPFRCSLLLRPAGGLVPPRTAAQAARVLRRTSTSTGFTVRIDSNDTVKEALSRPFSESHAGSPLPQTLCRLETLLAANSTPAYMMQSCANLRIRGPHVALADQKRTPDHFFLEGIITMTTPGADIIVPWHREGSPSLLVPCQELISPLQWP